MLPFREPESPAEAQLGGHKDPGLRPAPSESGQSVADVEESQGFAQGAEGHTKRRHKPPFLVFYVYYCLAPEAGPGLIDTYKRGN